MYIKKSILFLLGMLPIVIIFPIQSTAQIGIDYRFPIASYTVKVKPEILDFDDKGLNINFYILEGTFEGMFKGTFVKDRKIKLDSDETTINGDKAVIRWDGLGLTNLNTIIITEDGTMVRLQYKGRFDLGENWLQSTAPPLFIPLWTVMTFETENPNYRDIVRKIYQGVGELNLFTMEVSYNIYVLP